MTSKMNADIELEIAVAALLKRVRKAEALLSEALERERVLREALERATYIARNLLGMIPREVWRDQGGDDMQGHYEGDYYAERIDVEIEELTALSTPAPPEESDE